MDSGTYEHSRQITLDDRGASVQFILESPGAEVQPAAEQFCKDVAASLSMYRRRLDPFPTLIRVRLGDAPLNGKDEATAGDGPPLMEKVAPRFGLDDFVCGDEFRRILQDVLFYARRYPEIRARMGVPAVTRSFLVNFFGESGTGKTMAAEAFARELGKDLYVMNFANVESSLLGRTPKNIARAFRTIDPAASIIMLDEADAFVSRRIADLRQGAEYALNAARGQIISEIDRFAGTVILATNLFGTYDSAILRRIKFNLLFELPDLDALEQLYRRFLARAAGLPALDFRRLAEDSLGLSGGDAYNISEIIVMKCLQSEETRTGFSPDEVVRILAHYRLKNQRRGVSPAAAPTPE